MADSPDEFMEPAELRIGHYVHVETGWMSHPFPVNSFKIHSAEQLGILRSLGLDKVRISRDKSDPALFAEVAAAAAAAELLAPLDPEELARTARRNQLSGQQASLQQCERQFGEAGRAFRKITESVHAQPDTAGAEAQAVVDAMVGDLLSQHESCIRLLSEKMGERGGAQHGVNVTVLSLLLARTFKLEQEDLAAIGMGAFLHDIGKIDLPDRLRFGEAESAAEQSLYRDHVNYGLTLGKKMGLPGTSLLVIAQHHEFADGSGYPQHVNNERMSLGPRIVSLVNRYDNLVNPANPVHAITPHEALAQIYAQSKAKFDTAVLSAFIRMMGVYPPGSVVQLSDERYAIVVSVNASRPLKPCLIVFDEKVPRAEALVFDLADDSAVSIRRSLRPLQLPRAAIDYLSPRERICYYFERGRSYAGAGGEE